MMRKVFGFLMMSVMAGAVISCAGLNKASTVSEAVTMNVTSEYLSGGDLALTVQGIIPAAYTNTNSAISVVPVLTSRDAAESVTLPTLLAEGKLHRKYAARSESLSEGTTFPADIKIAFQSSGDTRYEIPDTLAQQPWMSDAMVTAFVYAEAYGVQIPVDTLYSPLSVCDLRQFIDKGMQEKYYNPPLAAEPVGIKAGSETVDFVIKFAAGESKIADGAVPEQIKNLAQEWDSAWEKPRYMIDIEVSDSPEGLFRTNEALVKARARAILSMLENIPLDTSNISVTVTPENWEVVSALLDASVSGSEGAPEGISAERAGQMKQVIADAADPDAREQKLAWKFGREWRILSQAVFPDLRYGKITITYTWDGNPGETRTYREENIGGVKAISFSPVRDSLPSAGILNERMLDKVRAAQMDEAEAVADSISVAGAVPMIICNKAMVYMHQGRTREAKALFGLCREIPEAAYNLGTMCLMDAQYAEAEPLLDSYICINKAVCKIALSKWDEAENVLLMLTPSQDRQALLDLVGRNK